MPNNEEQINRDVCMPSREKTFLELTDSERIQFLFHKVEYLKARENVFSDKIARLQKLFLQHNHIGAQVYSAVDVNELEGG